ncbi:MAG: sigma-70 family RNA polymerase sigma factor [Chitinophagaceae bacterium]
MERLHNEEMLVGEMQAGSEAAFTALYSYYSPKLYINLLGIVKDAEVAEEIVQELFTRVWHKKDSLGIKENFGGYVYRMAQHLAFDFFRSLKRDRALQEKFRLQAGEHFIPDEYELQHQQSSAILQKAIEQLPAQQKKVYELVKLDGHTYKKAAELLGISAFTVKEYLVAANKSIRKFILGHTDALILLLIACFQKK